MSVSANISLSDKAESTSQCRIDARTPSEGFIINPVHLKIDQKHMTLQSITSTEVKAHAVTYRRQIMDIVNRINVREIVEQPLLGFPLSIRNISNDDSNNSGSVVFYVETHELVGCVVPTLPKYICIKMIPHLLSKRKPGKGRWTDSDNALASSDPGNVEAAVMLACRKLILANVTPNLCLLYKYCVISRWKTIDEGLPLVALENWRRWDTNTPKLIRETAVVMLTEYCRMGSLRQVVKNKGLNTHQWRSVLFQIFYTLAVMDDAWRLKHWDLHLGNILVQDSQSNTPWKYTYNKRSWYVENFGLSVRLFDFDWCSATGIVNAKVVKSMNNPHSNISQLEAPNVFDCHYLLNIVYAYKHTPNSVRTWIRTLYPAEALKTNSIYCEERRLKKGITVVGFPTPESLLSNGFFDKYLEPPLIQPPFCYEYESGGVSPLQELIKPQSRRQPP